MLAIQQGRSIIEIETGAGTLAFDAARGGQLVSLAVKNDLQSHALTPAPADPLADLVFETDQGRFSLAETTAQLTLDRPAPDYVRLTARAELPGCRLRVAQEYEIHDTGVLFCSLRIEIPDGAACTLRRCALRFALAPGAVRSAWRHQFSRDMTFKRDYSSLHPYTRAAMRRPIDEPADLPELAPLVSLDLGWEETRFCSNHVEFLLEDAAPFDDGDPARGRTRLAYGDGLFRLDWQFWNGPDLVLRGPRGYRNRWGLLLGRARTQRGADADPAARQNLLGCRVCHIKYPYAREGADWPWVVMPIKQVPEQPPQLFEGNPPIARADEAADAGADTVILHQFWMRNPGTNNEPAADYVPFDPTWMRAFIDRCHARGMRVLPYIRGTEQWCHFAPFFEDYCRPDFDGLYADWNTPFFMGYVKASPLHLSLHNYFHFTRALRQRVGPHGPLLGHTNNANMVSLACFDAALSGETSVRHDELLVNPEMTASYAGLSFAGGHLISGNLPDRKAFASPVAMALCAALGMASQPALEPGKDFARCSAYMKPLWDALRALPGSVTRLHNPAFAPTRAVRADTPALFPSLWQSDAHAALLVVTCLGEPAGAAAGVEVMTGELDVPAGAKIAPLPIPGTFAGARVTGGRLALAGMPAGAIAAFLIR